MTDKGIETIKRHEGLRLKAYFCPAKVLTIGYGHTGGVNPGMAINLIQADKMLSDDLMIAEKDARSLVYNFDLISPVRQDCLINLAFNLGKSRLSKFVNFLNAVRMEQ